MLQLKEENIKKSVFFCPVVSHLLPSGTDVRELPAKIRVLRELERLLRSNCSMSEMWLSTTNKELINYRSHTIKLTSLRYNAQSFNITLGNKKKWPVLLSPTVDCGFCILVAKCWFYLKVPHVWTVVSLSTL